NDGILNGTELDGNVDVQIDLPAGVEAGDTVNVTDGTTTTPIVITPTDITNGNVTTSFTPPAEGEIITVTATITDIAGNIGPSTTDSALIDTTAPTTTVNIDSISDDSGVVGDFITNDNDGLTVGATLSAALVAGEALMYSNDNGANWSDITSSVTATAVSYDDANLTSTNTVQMKVVDLAGNDGAVDTQLVTIAFTGPNNLITITSITDDTGSSSSDFVTNDNNGLTVAATLTNTLDTGAGEKLMYSNDNGVTWIDITSSVTATAVSYDDANLTSTATVKMKVVDVSDNDGPVA
uniref:hypothetical protein n=1 Tax=Poseidonibacter antarcticus TaxID=2478538 RepID=UPI0019694A89